MQMFYDVLWGTGDNQKLRTTENGDEFDNTNYDNDNGNDDD